MTRFIFFFFFTVTTVGVAQNTMNLQLKQELDSIFELDQKYRAMMHGDLAQKSDSLAKVFQVTTRALPAHLWRLQNIVDSSNLARIEKIIAGYGYPGKTLVGSHSNEAAFFVIQHSTAIEKYLPLIEAAAKSGELPFHLYAMMLDRYLMYNNKEQVYGTQAMGYYVANPVTGEKETNMFIWPIKDPLNVNRRRREAGFELTVEEYAKRLGVVYKVLTMKDVDEMPKE